MLPMLLPYATILLVWTSISLSLPLLLLLESFLNRRVNYDCWINYKHSLILYWYDKSCIRIFYPVIRIRNYHVRHNASLRIFFQSTSIDLLYVINEKTLTQEQLSNIIRISAPFVELRSLILSPWNFFISSTP